MGVAPYEKGKVRVTDQFLCEILLSSRFIAKHFLITKIGAKKRTSLSKFFFIQLFRERLSKKNVHATIPKGNMGYVQYTVPDTVAVELLLLLSFSIRRHTSIASPAILSNFFEKQCTQNHPQYLSGLSRALYPTTFLEIAVYVSREL